MGTRLSYIPQLDGLRAIAVLLVLLLHAGFPVFQAGWIGVPVFFTLSGFLITSILLDSKDKPDYFKGFYLRRTLRIFPIYYLTLFAVLAWGLVMHYPVSQFFYYAFYLQSFTIPLDVEPFFCNNMLDHTWSLSVEEIFYLIWPAVVYVINRRNLIWLSVLLCLASLAYKIAQIYIGTEGLALMSLPGSIECLMAGVLLSIYRDASRPAFRSVHKRGIALLFLLVSVLIVIHYLQLDRRLLFFCKILLSFSVSWLSFFVILYFASSPGSLSSVNRAFSNRRLVYVGKISYGLYLYHFPVYMFVASFFYHYAISIHPIILLLIKLSTTFLIAALSWRFIEKPLLELKKQIKVSIDTHVPKNL